MIRYRDPFNWRTFVYTGSKRLNTTHFEDENGYQFKISDDYFELGASSDSRVFPDRVTMSKPNEHIEQNYLSV